MVNNSNFGYDCRKSLDNCQFVPIYNELQVILKNIIIFFDPKVSKFVTCALIAQEIEEKYNNDMIKLSKEDKFFKIKKSVTNTEKAQALNSLKELDKKSKRQKKKRNSFSLSRQVRRSI